MKRLGIIILLAWCATVFAAEVIPPAPANHFNDYAHVVSPATATRLNQELQDFERQTGNQIVVAVFPKMQSDSSIEDYTVRVAQAWKVGQKGRNNGAVLFVFINDRKMFLQVGYGLEGALPDALCKQIIENEIKPRFKAGDYSGGLSAGTRAIMAATKGEYKGSGRTAREQRGGDSGGIFVGVASVVFFGAVFLVILASVFGRKKGWMYTGSGYGGGSYGGGWGGGSSGGGWSSGDSGSFSGGGGSFGGGGSGGSW